VGALAAILLGVGAPVSGGLAESPPPQAHNDPPSDPQSGDPDASFSGYVGYLGTDAGATAAASFDETLPKHERFGRRGSLERHRPDVRGEAARIPSGDPGGLGAGVIPIPPAPDPRELARVHAAVAANGSARVVVMIRMAVKIEATLTPSERKAQRRAIRRALRAFETTLAGTGSRVLTRFRVVPSAVVILDQAGFDVVRRNPNVASITVDREFPAALDVSTGIIESNLLNAAGVLGNNFDGSTGGPYEVAILDTGVDNQHDAFTGRIVAQACFSAGSDCPNGSTSQLGGSAGDNCTYSTQCDHGTHVAGIAAGAPYPGGHEGVAPGARIVAIQVGSENTTDSGCSVQSPCWRYFFSDLNRALEHTYNLADGGRNVAAINLSLGGPLYATEAECGADFPTTEGLAANLQAQGVAVVAAAGNNGSITQVTYPGCLPSSYAVGATDDSDAAASFTNSGAPLNWWAPGVGIRSAVPTSPTGTGSKSGTSMATPHVVGAFALLRECVPLTTPADVASSLDATGLDVTRSGTTRKRINVLDAATRTVSNNDFASPEVIPPAGGDDFDWNVCADAEAGEPGPQTNENSIWWEWTPGFDGTATISTEDAAGNATTFDTVLSVFTGDTLGTLNLVAFDDDSGSGQRSLVVFPAQESTTYRIRVDGFEAANGLVNLHTSLGPPPSCFDAAPTIVGTAGDDTINGTPNADVIVTGAGDDTVNGLSGSDRVCAGGGNDVVDVGLGDDLVAGGPGADVIDGGDGDDSLIGNAGGDDPNDAGDTISGGAGNDLLVGAVGNDVLDGGPGNDDIRGESGTDTVSYVTASAAVSASIATNTASGGAGTDTFTAVENLTGSAFDDNLVGDARANVLAGRGGDDTLDGMAGNDRLLGSDGDDVLRGRAGDDSYDGGNGVDFATYSAASAAVTVNLISGAAVGEGDDELEGIENLVGSAFDDVLTGSNGDNIVRGANGDDILRGRLGNDRYEGGGGVDTAGFEFAGTAVTASLSAATATGEGADELLSIANLTGSSSNDALTGSNTANTIRGGNGNDTLRGLDGDDTITGGSGNDNARGGDDDDTLRGEAGNDDLFGEAGADALNGGPDNDDCDGGTGVDTGVACEDRVAIP
jgi:Ca2+-binding RTX toxin-like protein/subtilisin family serine protease